MIPTSTSSAAAMGYASCELCSKVSPLSTEVCPRCGERLHLRKPHSLQRTWALLFAAAVLYLPANLLPIMTVHGLGGEEGSTILSGVITFWQLKAYPVAIVIFTASVLIPILKIAALGWLCLAAQGRAQASPRGLTLLYYVTELLGRWSMVDVFVVAILICLVQMGALMSITPGPAALSFTGVVVLTMFAAHSFDPRLLWDRTREAVTITD